jgi:hypothetical protein
VCANRLARPARARSADHGSSACAAQARFGGCGGLLSGVVTDSQLHLALVWEASDMSSWSAGRAMADGGRFIAAGLRHVDAGPGEPHLVPGSVRGLASGRPRRARGQQDEPADDFQDPQGSRDHSSSPDLRDPTPTRADSPRARRGCRPGRSARPARSRLVRASRRSGADSGGGGDSARSGLRLTADRHGRGGTVLRSATTKTRLMRDDSPSPGGWPGTSVVRLPRAHGPYDRVDEGLTKPPGGARGRLGGPGGRRVGASAG